MNLSLLLKFIALGIFRNSYAWKRYLSGIGYVAQHEYFPQTNVFFRSNFNSYRKVVHVQISRLICMNHH